MPIKKTTVTLAPYDGDGSLLHYTSDRPGETTDRAWGYGVKEWRANEPFTAALRIDHTISGRSAKYVIWKAVDDDKVSYPMFVTDLVDLIQHAKVEAGVCTARWIVRKRGANFGITLAPEVAR